MAKQNTGEGKAPLVIALVFFVLATITAGVLAYNFNQDLTGAQEAAKKSEADAKASAELLTKEREAKLLYKSALGVATEQDRTDLQGLRFKDDARKVHADMTKAINDRIVAAVGGQLGQFAGKDPLDLKEADVFRWDWAQTADLPPPVEKGLIDVSVRNYSQLMLAKSSFKVQDSSLKQQQQAIQSLSTALDNAKKAMEKRTESIPAEVAQGIKEAADRFEAFKKDFNTQSTQFRENFSKKDEETQSALVKAAKAESKAARVTEQNDRMAAQLDAKVDPFQFDKPQGKILRRNGSMIEINLGTAEKLRPGLTFSVMPSDTPSRGFEARLRPLKDYTTGQTVNRIVPKGSIEVVEILASDLAQCRVTEEESQVRDRILPGDLLYNAIWRKGQSEHIVLYGIFDLDGDGRDDVATLAKELTRMGVIVDAYYDFAAGKWVGEVTSQTTFAVEGYTPTVTANDGNRDGKIRIISAIEGVRKATKDKGIRILRPRDFFPRIGYKAKLDVTEDMINQAATFFIRTLPPGEAEAPKPGM